MTTISRLGRAALESRAMRRAVRLAVTQWPDVAVQPLVREAVERSRFANVRSWPDRVDGFEDLAFLFSSNQLNHGIALLTFDEAALLYRLGRDARTIVDVGRFRGGSTFILAAAMPPDGELWSYDLHVKLERVASGPERDAELAAALARYGLDERVRLIVGDSRTAEAPPQPCDLVFLDGDHSYPGARADYERWGERLRPGGHLLFHDAAGSTRHEGVQRVVAEVDLQAFARHDDVGSIAHFARR